jgi:hypothetical protein
MADIGICIRGDDYYTGEHIYLSPPLARHQTGDADDLYMVNLLV